MTYRLLKAEEWERLIPLFAKYGFQVPHLIAAAVAIAEDDQGEIQGVWVMQMALHTEPLILESPKVNFMRLFQTLVQPLEGKSGLAYYGFTDRPVTEGMAEKLGLERLPYTGFWKGTVQ